MRDGNSPRALDILVRYRGAVPAELFRSLAALEERQAQDQNLASAGPAPHNLPCARTKRIRKGKIKQYFG
jgi:hypothetical protein